MIGDTPPVSVIIPVFNGAAYLADAVSSVRTQGCADLELILVDDGSTDGTADVIRRLPQDGLRWVRQDNGGPARARNRGLRMAGGGIVAFLDADDLWPAGRLRRQLALLEHDASLDIVLGRTQCVQQTADAGGRLVLRESGPSFVLLSPTAAVFRRRAFARVGEFDEALRYGEDTDWFMRARERSIPLVVERDLALLYRRHPGNMTRGRSAKELQVLDVLKRSLDRRRMGSRHAAALPNLVDPEGPERRTRPRSNDG
jgi:glycosyltransferase involved in cell wall biosynthesis